MYLMTASTYYLKISQIPYGVGTPDYLFESVERGVDMFDVLPTKASKAWHGDDEQRQG